MHYGGGSMVRIFGDSDGEGGGAESSGTWPSFEMSIRCIVVVGDVQVV